MSECVHGNEGQDDGNKGNGDYGEHYGGEAACRLIRCQSSV